jgi:N6-L-threonylcarbamoyladenine synthase
VVEDGNRILSNEVASQTQIHGRFGGVVPELASREHLKVIVPLLHSALEHARRSLDEMDAIAVTAGPGLVGSLLVGISFAKSLAYVKRKPLVPVHHLEGHIYANIAAGADLPFPFVALIASGGHTDLIECSAPLRYTILGRTRDDAAGEAFDKVAKMLDLGYPGGPAIERAAAAGDPGSFRFPRPMLAEPGFDFSFSGLKTAVLYALEELRKSGEITTRIPDIAASFQLAVSEVLAEKSRRAVHQTGIKRLALGGGVIANTSVREMIASRVDGEVFTPPRNLCIDNAAMTAAAGYDRYRAGYLADMSLNAEPNLRLHSDLWKELQRA